MSTELVAILERWNLNGPSARVNVKLGVLREAADELTALTARAQDAEAAMQTYFEQLLSEHNAKVEAQRANTALTAKVALLTEALRPFSHAAGGVFTRNFNASDVLFLKSATASHAESKITAGDLFAARRALSEPDKEGT